VYDYVYEKLRTKPMGKLIFHILLFILAGGFILLFPMWPAISLMGVRAGVPILIILKTAIFLIVSYYLFKILTVKRGRRGALKLIGIPVLLLAILIPVLGSATDGWSEWRCRLVDRSQAAGVRIYFPKDFRIQPGEACRIAVDMTASHGLREPFLLTTNGEMAPFYFDRPPVSQFYYHKTTYDVFQLVYDMGMQEMRNWRSIPLNPQTVNRLLARDGYLDFKIQPSNRLSDSKSYIDIFGFYPSEPKGEIYVPSFSYYSTSIERFIEKGDPRIWMKYRLYSDSVISYYIDGDKERQNPDDLSPSAGRQYGRYGIFLEVKRVNESLYHY
jgi:hypothetical protein